MVLATRTSEGAFDTTPSAPDRILPGDIPSSSSVPETNSVASKLSCAAKSP